MVKIIQNIVFAESSLGSEELLRLLQLRRTYLSADSMLAELQVQLKAEDDGPYEPRRVTDEEKRKMMQVMLEKFGAQNKSNRVSYCGSVCICTSMISLCCLCSFLAL